MESPQLSRLSALVVEPALTDTMTAVSTLAGAGFQVTTAHTFGAARQRLASRPPSILLTAVRLGEYNGLHLVVRARSAHPHLAAIVTSDYPDTVLEAEAERLGAAFVVKPIASRDLLALACRILFRRPDDLTPVRAPYERRTGERRGAGGAPFPQLERRRTDRRRDLLAHLQAATAESMGWKM